jgi:Histidine kinase/GHKL domain
MNCFCMKKFIKIFPHILVWGIILLVPVYFMLKDGALDKGAYISYMIRTSILAILFYFNYLYLIDRFLFRKQFVGFLLANILLVAALSIFQSVLQDLLTTPHFPKFGTELAGRPPKPPGPPLGMVMFSNYVLNIFVLGLSVALKMTIQWYGDSIKFEQVKSGQLEADLRNLRSQLNPHFLFNTLNNIYSLIAIDQNKAQDSVHRLSNLLRYVLYDNNSNFVPIEKELEFTRNYIDLMKLRLSSNMKLNVMIENKGSNDLIASLMFMTLIENAFKHGSSTSENAFIDIKIFMEKESGVLCTVENSVHEKGNQIESANSGIGLVNLSKRLELLYPEKHQFEIEHRPHSFFAMLRIDFK